MSSIRCVLVKKNSEGTHDQITGYLYHANFFSQYWHVSCICHWHWRELIRFQKRCNIYPRRVAQRATEAFYSDKKAKTKLIQPIIPNTVHREGQRGGQISGDIGVKEGLSCLLPEPLFRDTILGFWLRLPRFTLPVSFLPLKKLINQWHFALAISKEEEEELSYEKNMSLFPRSWASITAENKRLHCTITWTPTKKKIYTIYLIGSFFSLNMYRINHILCWTWRSKSFF